MYLIVCVAIHRISGIYSYTYTANKCMIYASINIHQEAYRSINHLATN